MRPDLSFAQRLSGLYSSGEDESAEPAAVALASQSQAFSTIILRPVHVESGYEGSRSLIAHVAFRQGIITSVYNRHRNLVAYELFTHFRKMESVHVGQAALSFGAKRDRRASG